MSLTSRRTAMARKRYKPEEIVAKLRQVDVLVSQGQNMVDAIRQIGVSEVTYYRWRQEFGGLKSEQVKRLKDLELENSRLRKAVSDWLKVPHQQPKRGRATSRASMPAFAMSCSTARFSTLCARPRSSSRVGDATTTRSGPTPQSDTSHQHQRSSCPHSPRGRLRYADRLRRPRWRNGQPYTNIPPGPLSGGWSIASGDCQSALRFGA